MSFRLLALQLESDEPEYDMDKIDLQWFNEIGCKSCPKLTHHEYEIINDTLENASARTLISFDEAQTLLATVDKLHLTSVYEFWQKRRTTGVDFLNLIYMPIVFCIEREKIEINLLNYVEFNKLTSFSSFFSCLSKQFSNSLDKRSFALLCCLFFFLLFTKIIRAND